MNRVQRLAAIVAELRARKLAEAAVPLATEALRAAGFKVHLSGEWGLSVDAAPGLRAALDDLSARGVHPPAVFILRKFDAKGEAEAFGEDEEHASGTAETAKASNRDRDGRADAPRSAAPATPYTRVDDPTTHRRRNG